MYRYSCVIIHQPVFVIRLLPLFHYLLGYLIFVILCKANVESTGIMGLDINPVALASKFTLFAHDAKNTSKLGRNGKECFSC